MVVNIPSLVMFGIACRMRMGMQRTGIAVRGFIAMSHDDALVFFSIGYGCYHYGAASLPVILAATVFDKIREARKELTEKYSVVENFSAIEITEKQYRKALKDMRSLF
ncbi:MAG: hypothetical protein LBE21_04815 [Pseudomonadales bacterium]|jgi:hypothetical protein|nr:hypothetical protein [Pseudomonadales bacterium]